MSTTARKRLMRDFKRLQKDAPAGIQAAPLDNNVMAWQAVIFGPDDTAWEGGTFKLLLEFTEEYPNKPPSVRFLSKIFHPNVYADGKICLDILQNQWSPIYDISAILTSIQSLLSDPNPQSPANSEASTLFESDKREYHRRVRIVVEESWLDDDADEDAETEDLKVSATERTSPSAANEAAAGTTASTVFGMDTSS
eukprot:GSChrysophyteH1.ASY1.ANO1.1803.1 assembled CDS